MILNRTNLKTNSRSRWRRGRLQISIILDGAIIARAHPLFKVEAVQIDKDDFHEPDITRRA